MIVSPEFESRPRFKDEEKLVLRLATALTRTPANVSGELFKSFGITHLDRQMIELTARKAKLLLQRFLQILQIRLLPVLAELLQADIGQWMVEHHFEDLEWHCSNMGPGESCFHHVHGMSQ